MRRVIDIEDGELDLVNKLSYLQHYEKHPQTKNVESKAFVQAIKSKGDGPLLQKVYDSLFGDEKCSEMLERGFHEWHVVQSVIDMRIKKAVEGRLPTDGNESCVLTNGDVWVEHTGWALLDHFPNASAAIVAQIIMREHNNEAVREIGLTVFTRDKAAVDSLDIIEACIQVATDGKGGINGGGPPERAGVQFPAHLGEKVLDALQGTKLMRRLTSQASNSD